MQFNWLESELFNINYIFLMLSNLILICIYICKTLFIFIIRNVHNVFSPKILVHTAMYQKSVLVKICFIGVDPCTTDLIGLLEQHETVSIQLGHHVTGYHQTCYSTTHNSDSRFTTRHDFSIKNLRKLYISTTLRTSEKARRERV